MMPHAVPQDTTIILVPPEVFEVVGSGVAPMVPLAEAEVVGLETGTDVAALEVFADDVASACETSAGRLLQNEVKSG